MLKKISLGAVALLCIACGESNTVSTESQTVQETKEQTVTQTAQPSTDDISKAMGIIAFNSINNDFKLSKGQINLDALAASFRLAYTATTPMKMEEKEVKRQKIQSLTALDSLSDKQQITELSNLIGEQLGMNAKDFKMPFNQEIIISTIDAGIREDKAEYSMKEALTMIQDYELAKMEQMASKAKAKIEQQTQAGQSAAQFHIEAGAKFLAENAKKEGVVTTASGLQYKILQEGKGAKPTAADKVQTHYHGTLIDGTVFDSSVERGEPIAFPVGGVILGWQEALQLMSVGAKYKLFIPYNLAYGKRAAGQIPAGATLIFEVELLDIIQ